MDPALVREKEKFRQRALAIPVVEKKTEPKKEHRDKPSKPKKKSKLSRPKPQPLVPPENVDQIRQAALSGHRSNNPYRVLKAVVDMMKQRYCAKKYTRLGLEEILTEINLTDLRTDLRQWLSEALKNNAKIAYYPDEEQFLFRPALGLEVRNRRQLLERLREYEREGLGGIPKSEVEEALPNPKKAIEKLEKEDEIFCITRPDKEDVLFYKNHEYEVEVDEEFKALWHRVSVEGRTETDIEQYLENVGLGVMQGETRKRKAPGSQPGKPRKKTRAQKVLNTHLDSDLLKDYSEGAPTKK